MSSDGGEIVKDKKQISIEGDGRELLEIDRIYPEVPAALDHAVLSQAARCRYRGKRNFFVKHVAQYTALAAAVCLCCLAPFYFGGPERADRLTTPRTAAQWDWKVYDSLNELSRELDGSTTTGLTSGSSYYGSELTLDAVIESLNNYEVIL